ncbi:hypothetical protein HOI83_00905 [Candidatus Uhrbacteria bacterium]|jgi:hypothetical protein|nr:hypothetical protein [Candidatus Uhrbacteria bacterium]
MQPINWIREKLALGMCALITLVFVLFVFLTGWLYEPIHRRFMNGMDSPYAYISTCYHEVVVLVCYRWIAGMKFEHDGMWIPELYDGKYVMFVPGGHSPDLLMIPYYYVVCTYLSRRLLVTTKPPNPDNPDHKTELFAMVLGWIRCHIPLPRGSKMAHEELAALIKSAIETYARFPRALTMYTDGSRPKQGLVAAQRVRYSEMLRDQYGIEDDLSWLKLSLFPQMRGFIATIDAMPDEGRVVFLFAGLNKAIWSFWESSKLIDSTFRFYFIEEELSELKRRADEDQKDWERRITLLLIGHWKDYNKRMAAWQQA